MARAMLCAWIGVAGSLWVSGASGEGCLGAPRAAQDACVEADNEEAQLMQRYHSQTGEARPKRPRRWRRWRREKRRRRAREGPKEFESEWQWTHEVFADITLEDFACGNESGAEESISRQCWVGAFSRLDRNSDGVISAADLHHAEDEERRNEQNLTRKDVWAGLALLAQWYPEESARLMMNGPLITALAYRGVRPPSDMVAPPNPLAGVPAVSSLQVGGLRNTTNRTALLEVYTESCVSGVVRVTGAALGMAFRILGISLPGSGLIGETVTSNVKVVNEILRIVRARNSVHDSAAIARDVYSILKLLHQEGVFQAVVKHSLGSLSWWDWAVTSARVAGTVALWFASGPAAFVLQVSMAALDAVGLVRALAAVRGECL